MHLKKRSSLRAIVSPSLLFFLVIVILVLAQEEFSNDSSVQGELLDPTLVGVAPNEVLSEQAISAEQIAVTEEEPSEATIITEPEVRPPLATVVNGERIEGDNYAQEYLQLRGFFDNLPFETMNEGGSIIFNAGNTPEDVKGFVFNNRLYAIHLVLCTEEHQSCYFRVNGMPTGRITTKDSDAEDVAKFFTLDETYRLEVNSIQFNYCGTYRFCDMRHEAYDLVNVSIISANEE